MRTNKTASKRRFGYTLVELLIATGVSSMLVVGLPSSIFIVSQSLKGDTASANRSSTAEIQTTIINDVKHAVSLGELTSTAITMTVPDRDNDGDSEIIRYSWSGVAGDPLMYQYNAGTAVSFADDIHQFDLTSLTRFIAAPVIPDPDVITTEESQNFGYNDQYASTWDGYYSFAMATKVTLEEDGYLQSLSAYINAGNPGEIYRLGIYSDQSGTPKKLMATTSQLVDGGTGWKTEPVTETYLLAGTYWIAVSFSSSNQKVYYQNGIGVSHISSSESNSFAFFSPWSGTYNSYNHVLSIYGTYTTESQN